MGAPGCLTPRSSGLGTQRSPCQRVAASPSLVVRPSGHHENPRYRCDPDLLHREL